MGKRAELRRQAKEEKRKTATFNMTKEQLDEYVEREIKERLPLYREQLYG